jgi:hypothetical protein
MFQKGSRCSRERCMGNFPCSSIRKGRIVYLLRSEDFYGWVWKDGTVIRRVLLRSEAPLSSD